MNLKALKILLYKNTFYNSHFWYKNQLIEIVWYLYEDGKSKTDFRITHSLLFSFPVSLVA